MTTFAPGDVTLAPFNFRVVSLEVTSEISIEGIGSVYAWGVVLRMNVDDRNNGLRSRVTFRQQFDKHRFPTAHQAVRQLLLEALTHEADECLLVDGVRVNDPHAEEKR
jgi:hypothetical protein